MGLFEIRFLFHLVELLLLKGLVVLDLFLARRNPAIEIERNCLLQEESENEMSEHGKHGKDPMSKPKIGNDRESESECDHEFVNLRKQPVLAFVISGDFVFKRLDVFLKFFENFRIFLPTKQP